MFHTTEAMIVFAVLALIILTLTLRHIQRVRREQILPDPDPHTTRGLSVGCVGTYDVQLRVRK